MRARALEQVQHRFATQQHRVVDIQNRISEIKDQLQLQFLIPSDEDTLCDPFISQQRFAYIQYLKKQMDRWQSMLRREESILNQIREEMRQAHIKKKSLELLEDKQRTAYMTTLANKEMNELEDIVMARRHFA